MKKSFFASLCIALLVTAFYVFINANNRQNLASQIFNANVEALADQEEVVIICSSGNCGECFVEKTAWPLYRCVWTGIATDFCDCDKFGYTGPYSL